MFDASAKLPKTGMLKGRRHFPGNMDSCLEIKAAASDLEFTGEAGYLVYSTEHTPQPIPR